MRQTATLEVVIPPDIVNEETSGDMMVPEGGSAKLVCRARGHPKPKITWRREDGREIIARNGAHQKTKGKQRDTTIEKCMHFRICPITLLNYCNCPTIGAFVLTSFYSFGG